MKKKFLIGAFAICASVAFGQEIPQSEVPSVVVNNFQKSFPKAMKVEWEKKADLFEVKFEIGTSGNDHDAWYDSKGTLVKHKEEISKSELPSKVSSKINSDFSGYRIDDVSKTTEGSKTTYKMELKKDAEEWKVVVDSEGKVLSKIAD